MNRIVDLTLVPKPDKHGCEMESEFTVAYDGSPWRILANEAISEDGWHWGGVV